MKMKHVFLALGLTALAGCGSDDGRDSTVQQSKELKRVLSNEQFNRSLSDTMYTLVRQGFADERIVKRYGSKAAEGFGATKSAFRVESFNKLSTHWSSALVDKIKASTVGSNKVKGVAYWYEGKTMSAALFSVSLDENGSLITVKLDMLWLDCPHAWQKVLTGANDVTSYVLDSVDWWFDLNWFKHINQLRNVRGPKAIEFDFSESGLTKSFRRKVVETIVPAN